jgi:hypothetical protein
MGNLMSWVWGSDSANTISERSETEEARSSLEDKFGHARSGKSSKPISTPNKKSIEPVRREPSNAADKYGTQRSASISSGFRDSLSTGVMK